MYMYDLYVYLYVQPSSQTLSYHLKKLDKGTDKAITIY